VFLLLISVYISALEIGTGVADITPDTSAYKVPMAGYGSRLGRPSTGVHDPLCAKVLYLTDGEQRMALITADLRSSTPEFKGQIVSKTADLGLTMENIFIAASHTHDGPSMYPEKFWQMQFGKYDPAIVDIMTTAIAKAVHEATASTQPVRMGYAATLAEGLTRNRRWGYDTEKREAAGESPVMEPRLTVIRFDSLDGECLALTVHFAAHPDHPGCGQHAPFSRMAWGAAA
jgi:neutral ceramidase